MIEKYRLNRKRLSKSEVKLLVDNGASLDENYSQFFLEKYPSGLEVKNLIYRLPDNHFLFVAGTNSLITPNKGDIYTEEYLLRWIRSKQRLEKDAQLGITSSVSKWRHYSKVGNQLIESVDNLIIRLSEKLNIDIKNLDKSYPSLSLVDTELNKLNLDFIFKNIYDELVAYVGEVIIKRVNGKWDINQNFAGGNYPYISIGDERVQYMPLNAVVCSLNEIDDVNLRLETANEIRSQSGRLSFESMEKKKSNSSE